MNTFLVILLCCFIVLTYLHYRRYCSVERALDILQINSRLHHGDYKDYFRENVPVVILNHTQVDMHQLFPSPLTISTQFCKLSGTELATFHTHRHDLLFIRLTDESPEAVVNLSPPPSKGSYKFGRLPASTTIPGMTQIQVDPASAVQVMLRPGTILLVPRFWRVQIDTPVQAELTWTNTPFSLFFQKIVSKYV